MTSIDYDVCVIGSGAGGGPVAYSLAAAGYRVIVLEKGPFLTEKDFFKDEVGESIRSKFRPYTLKEPRVIERLPEDLSGNISSIGSFDRNLWNATMVGGATNIMSGFFFRMKPEDFSLRSLFGPVKNGNIVDWPITYQQLEPYYTLAEKIIGISGNHLPQPPLEEHPLAHWLDLEAKKKGWNSLPVARAILSRPLGKRNSCSYSGLCGMYACPTGAKGSSRVALLEAAIATGHCEIRAEVTAKAIKANSRNAVSVEYFEKNGSVKTVRAKVFVLACQAIETARLLLLSADAKHPKGLANSSGMVGKNLIFSMGSGGTGKFHYSQFSKDKLSDLRNTQPFINRSFQDWYFYKNGEKKMKGGTLLFLLEDKSPISAALGVAYQKENSPLWGEELNSALKDHFLDSRIIDFETFADWIPNDQTQVTLDTNVKDRFGLPVAHIKIKTHSESIATTNFLKEKGGAILHSIGAKNIQISETNAAATNLVAGTCRFGNDPRTSVLNADCQAHDVDNLFITDGSFMPTGGSVPFTWTIYANAFRTADKIIKYLGVK